MVVASDSSYLFSLYGNDVNSHRALTWIERYHFPIVINSLTIFELENAIRFSEFRKAIDQGSAAKYCSGFRSAIEKGRLVVEVTNLADVIKEAKRMSESRTLTGGHRGFDILHVAGALMMKASHFLTFDHNQKKLAEAEGLIVPEM